MWRFYRKQKGYDILNELRRQGSVSSQSLSEYIFYESILYREMNSLQRSTGVYFYYII